MSIRAKLFLAFSVVLALAVGVAAYGIRAISDAEGLVVRLYDQPFMAVSYARAAQAKFSDARAAMERGWLLRDAARESNDAILKATKNEIIDDLTIVGQRLTQAGHAERVFNAQQLVKDWYQMGLRTTEAPSDGLTGLPLSNSFGTPSSQNAVRRTTFFN